MTYIVVIKRKGSALGAAHIFQRDSLLEIAGYLRRRYGKREYVVWTDAMTDYLKNNYGRVSAMEIARAFSRDTGQNITKNSVISKANALGLCKPKAAS